MSARGGGMHMTILFNITLKDELGGEGGIAYISLILTIFRLYFAYINYHVQKTPLIFRLYFTRTVYISLIFRLYYYVEKTKTR